MVSTVQPFEIFDVSYVHRLIILNKPYLVSQTYHRIPKNKTAGKTAILLTDYDDPGLAGIHLAAVSHDPFAAIINLNKPKHAESLRTMLAPESAYVVYWSVVKNAEAFQKNIQKKFATQMRRYLLANTEWQVSLAESINPKMQVIFGELFVTIKRGGDMLRVKFCDIEKA